MKPLGPADVAMQWNEAYFSGRVSRAYAGGELSETIPTRSGVSQGSVVGPLLFFSFPNDLPDALEVLTLLFSDDVKMGPPRTQNINLHSPFTGAWDLSKK